MALFAAMIVYFVGGACLRMLAARAAARAGRSDFVSLVTNMRWMWEPGQTWSLLARVALAWFFGGLLLGLGLVAGKIASLW